jgi:hypothetical protein
MMNQQLISKDADIADLKGQVDEERAKSSGRLAASGDDNLRMLLEERELEVAKAKAEGEERVRQVSARGLDGALLSVLSLMSVCRSRARCLGRLRMPGGVPLRRKRSQTRSTRLLPSTHP